MYKDAHSSHLKTKQDGTDLRCKFDREGGKRSVTDLLSELPHLKTTYSSCVIIMAIIYHHWTIYEIKNKN